MQSSVPFVYGDMVVVEDDKDVGLHRTGVVQAFESHASCHGPVSYDRNYLFVAAGEFRGYGHAEGGAYGCG